jgi:hypothetical protein
MIIARRSFVHGVSGGAAAGLLAPLLRTLEAEAAGAPPRRFVLFQTANGMQRSLYRQAGLPGAKEVKAPLEASLALREILAPLAPWRERLLLLEGFANPFDHDLHGNVFASLCVRPRVGRGPGGISLDRFCAQQIGKGDAFSSLALATVWHDSDNASRAADGAQAPFPALAVPTEAFAKIFAAGAPADPALNPVAAAQARAARRQSLLDFVRDDVRRLRERVGGVAQKKLDQYTESLRAVEKQALLQAQSVSSCKNAGAPAGAFKKTSSPSDAQIDAQIAIGAQALICGLTRVVNVSFGTSDGGISHYGFPALKHTGSHHQYCHAGNVEAQTEIHTYVFQKIAAFLRRLEEVPEAGGTMLDNTLAIVVNDGGGSHHGGYDDIPLLVIGRAGGAFRTGRIVSVLNALGVLVKTFGDPAVNKGPLTEVA